MPIRRMTEAEAEAMRKSAAQRRAALYANKNSSTTTSRKTNFVSPTSLVKNSASNKTSTKTSSKTSRKSTTKVNSSPVRGKSSGTTSYFQPKTSAKSKTIRGRKTTSYTPWYRRDRLDMSNRKSSKDRLGGSSAYAEDYLARLLPGMSEKDWFLTNAEQALDFRSLLSNKLLTGENKLTPSQRLAMKSPLNWAQTNANLKRSTGMDLAEFNTKYLGSKLTAEEFAKRQKEDRDYWADQVAKAAEYELSPYDKKLPRTDRQRIQKEKMRWDVANSLGDFETRNTAHKMAETIRARYGYSGGAAGDQKIAADITWQDAAALNAMNAEGQGKYRMAKLELEQAVKEGNEGRIGAAEEKLSQILANPNYRSSAKPGTQNVTGHDVPRADTSDNWMDQAVETLKAVGYGVPGSLAFLAETQGQAIDDRLVEENYDYIRSKAAELPTLQARLSLVQRGEGSESWGTEEQLQKQIAIAQNMQDMLDSYGQMDQNSLGSRLMAKSQEHAAAALEGTSGLDRLLTQTAISMGQNLPGIAANFIPVVGPAIGLGLMGAQAAGSRSYELTQQGVSPSEALSRGLVSGGIEALTEKIPLESLTKIIKGTTGASFVKNLLKQMGIEATEESASYTANYLADKIAKDPNAEWSPRELLENAAAGALSGGFFAAGGQAIGSALNRQAVTEAAAPAPQQTQTDLEAQAREQALEMLAETAPGREIVPKTEPTTQQAAEATVQSLREAATTTPASVGNAQQEHASKAQAPSAAAKASPAAKTIKLRRVSGQTQTASARQTASPKAQGALQQAQTALLTQMSKTLGTSGEKAMLAAWDNRGDPGQYSAGFVRVYNQALSGTTAGKIQAPASLNDAQVMAAYSAGQNDRKLSLEQAREAAQQAEVANKNASLYASEEGTEAGLVYDSYVQESMDPDTAASLSSVAKQLGLRVQMVDSVAGGMANADIQGSAVQIEKNNPNPVRALFGHELTHRVQQLAPESYRAFRDYVMQSGKAQADVQKKIAEYKRAGVKLTTEEAMDEIAADYAGEMIEDQDLLKQFIQKNKENKNVLRRFLEAVRDMARKLTGKYQKQAKDAVALLEKAVGDASRQASKLQASKNTAGKGKTKYSVKETDSSELRKLEAVEIDPYEISTINDITDRKKFDYLVSEFEKSGWEGRPVVIVENGNDGYKALTGSHRILAAKEANIMVKAVVVEYSSDIDDLVSADSDEERASVAKDLYRDGVLSDAAYQLIIREDDLNFENFDVPYADQKRFSMKSPGKVISENEKLFDDVGVSYDAETESVSPARFSLKTWNASGYVTKRDEAAKVLADALKISQKKAKQYIDNVNSIAKMIADDRMRLDYEASPGRSSFVSNSEYGGSIDFSTICKKRRLFTGTFEAIQEALPDTALTAEEFLEIRSMMAEKGYEVSCGLCYVEGSRANMGQYTKQFIERYAATNPEYVPNMAEMNTASGQEKLRKEHPEVYEAYEYFMNHYGRLKPGDKALFASQQKPKMYQMATEYQGEILKKFGKKNSSVENKNANGGLRLQSFSDFEIIHLIDSMQVIMDMSRVGLAGQAYTKVPDFAWALGDTGLKINLSLIAKGVDGNGRLVLDEVEGMAEADAMALRERYSDNVGTVLVAFTDRQLLAAMADERIDFIIPFHRSQWKTDQYEAMGLPANAKDFTPWQNEAYIEPVYNASGKKQRPSNYMPNNYWNFRKSGKKNAEAYLKMCAENNRRPKFHYLLDKNNDGSYSLKKDGSTDGYWKLLIDFKMYNNEGKGVPQRPVLPEFNMEQAERMLNEYSGGHSKFPAAQDVVDEFVSKYKLEHPDTAKFSLKGSDDYQGLIEKYGAIEQGENPRARDVQVPRQTADGKKVSRTVRTVMEAAATPDAMVPTIQEMVEKGEFSYEVASDKAAIENAEATIREKGFQAALMDWTSALASGKVNKQNTATGWALYNAAAQAGDVKTAADIMSKIVYHQRDAAQAVQATRILKQMVPGAQLYGIQRSVQNMQDELRSKYGDKAPDLKIPDELVETYLNAESQQERDEAEKEIYISIGKQMPSTFQDKWNAWRYLAMLFNFRTHIRNVVGNAGFAIPVLAKNAVGTALEGIGSAVSGGKMQRTKGLYGVDLFKAAWKDYQNAKPQIMAGGKYDDSVAKRDAIEEGRRIFKNRFLEGLRRFNSGALELEDGWFAKPHYANALAQYCAANKITAEQLETGEGLDQAALDKARAYAIQEAQKATYRDFNDFSDFISSVGRYSGDNKVKKVFSAAVEGVLPFRKTPANILVRAVEYSPIGLIDGIWELTYGVKTGKNTAAEALDRLSAGLTGTGLFALGVYLAAQGLLMASGDDDDKQKAYDDLLGKQEYAIQLPDGTNFTIDWLAPECIPVFMGAEYFKAMDDRENGGEFSLTMFLDAMSKVTNPMLEMSCLSSLNDLFDNLSGYKTGDVSSLVVVVANMAVSYLTQGVPTLLGQGERSSQEDRMTTYTDKNKDLPSDWQYTLGKVSGKIPGWDYGQIPYIDAWGQKETESSTAKRIVNNFVNPAYTSKFQKDKVEGELQRLYTETGESVLPERAERYFNLGDERVDLTGEQYVTYATEKGQRSYALVSSFVNASYYGSQTDGDRTAAIDMLYTYATEQAKKAVFPEYTSSQSWVEKANAAIEEGVKPEVYIYLYSKTRGVESLKDSKGETIKNSKGLQIMEAVNDSGVTLTDKQKALLLDDFGVGKTVIGYNPAKVKQELSKMR